MRRGSATTSATKSAHRPHSVLDAAFFLPALCCALASSEPAFFECGASASASDAALVRARISARARVRVLVARLG